LVYHTHFSENQIKRYAFYKIVQYSEIPGRENKAFNIFCTQGQIDPGTICWAPWPMCQANVTSLAKNGHGHGGSAGKHGGGAPARETERKRVLEKQQLTLSSPEVVAWPEMSRRRRIWRRRRSGPASESATASAIPGVLARFFGRGDRGRRGEPSQQLGGARGGS
jgi:hypothetical protein